MTLGAYEIIICAQWEKSAGKEDTWCQRENGPTQFYEVHGRKKVHAKD
jgi:hypothetical protein